MEKKHIVRCIVPHKSCSFLVFLKIAVKIMCGGTIGKIMKCEKCGREIDEFEGYCFYCRWEEEKAEDSSYDVKLFDVKLFNLFSFSITKNTKYSSIEFFDHHFSPNFDYKYKYIPLPFNPTEFLSSMFFGMFFGSLCLIAYFWELSQRGSAPSWGLYLSLGLFFMGGLSLFISFIPPYLNFNPDISKIRKHYRCNINRKGVIFENFGDKTNEEEIEEHGKFKLSIYPISDQMEQVKFEIPKENIKGIEIRKIYEIENEYDYIYIDLNDNNYMNKKESYYALYLQFVNPIYIYDKKEKKNKKKKKIEFQEIRLISHIFSESVDLEKLKNEYENILGLTKK